jgi:AraC-like DNA-binding protein
MQRAAMLLETTDDKLTVIARTVGYRTPFAFSTAFKRWSGHAPATHRSSRADRLREAVDHGPHLPKLVMGGSR